MDREERWGHTDWDPLAKEQSYDAQLGDSWKHPQAEQKPENIGERGYKWKSAVFAAGGLAVALAFAGGLYAGSKSHPGNRFSTGPEKTAAVPQAPIFFIIKSVNRAARDEYSSCRGQSVPAPRYFRRRDILTYNEMLRGRLGEPPIVPDKLLDYAAQHTAQQVADNPGLMQPGNFKKYKDKQAEKIKLKGRETNIWSEVHTDVLQIPSGQTAFAVGCFIDSRAGGRDIRQSGHIGVGSVLSKVNHQRYLVLDYGISTG